MKIHNLQSNLINRYMDKCPGWLQCKVSWDGPTMSIGNLVNLYTAYCFSFKEKKRVERKVSLIWATEGNI